MTAFVFPEWELPEANTLSIATLEIDDEFRVASFPSSVREAFGKVQGTPSRWDIAVSAAIEHGIRDPNVLANIAFYLHHPERLRGEGGVGLPISRAERGYERLRDEWLAWHLNVTEMLKSGARGSGKNRGGQRPAGSILFNHPFIAPKQRGVPFAVGALRPFFPVQTSKNHRFGEVAYKDERGRFHGNASRAFMARRGSGARYHAGIDLYADPGDLVVAPETGTIVRRQTFYAGTGAILVETDSGVVLLLGETKMGGSTEFGVDTGSRVKAGQPLTRVGRSNTGSHMLHVETYTSGTIKNQPWYKSKGRPSNLLDPSDYFLRAKARLSGGS